MILSCFIANVLVTWSFMLYCSKYGGFYLYLTWHAGFCMILSRSNLLCCCWESVLCCTRGVAQTLWTWNRYMECRSYIIHLAEWGATFLGWYPSLKFNGSFEWKHLKRKDLNSYKGLNKLWKVQIFSEIHK